MVDDASFDQVPADGTASFDSGRAMVRALMCAAGPDQMLADAGFALAQEEPWGWRYAAMRLCAEAHLLAGDADQAAVLFARASSEGASHSNPDGLVLSDAELALLDMDRGRWDEAAERVERALAVIDVHQLQDYALCVLGFVAAARLAVHRGDLHEANRQLTAAMRARPSLTFALPWLAVRTRLQLAKVYWALQDQSAARHLLREIDDILLQRPALGALVDEVSAFRRLSSSAPEPHGDRRVAPHASRASAAPVPADPPHDPRDRRASVRVAQHGELRGRLDLSKARRFVASRCGEAGNGDRIARRVTGATPTTHRPRPTQQAGRAQRPPSPQIEHPHRRPYHHSP